MKKAIHRLRSQPEETKRHILHILTIVAAILLVLLWIYSLGTRLANSDNQAQAKQDVQPLSTLKANLVSGYDSIYNGNNPNNPVQQ
jgi:hypothetical protein